jgi:AraC-like DNA-binding protein
VLSEIDFLMPAQVSVGTVTYPPGGTLGPRYQRDVQLVLVHSGSALIWVDDRPRGLSAGQVGLLLPGHQERFDFDRGTPTRHSWVQAYLPDISQELRERLERLPQALPVSPTFDAVAREAESAASSALPTAPAIVTQLACAAIWRYIGEAENVRPERTSPVDAALRLIHSELGDPSLTLSRIAEGAHVTPPHLIRSFRAKLGTTPIAYLWDRRVAVGIDLLANTGLPTAAIAERSGFKTVHHFARRVKSASGLPPAALRRSRWGLAPGSSGRRTFR